MKRALSLILVLIMVLSVVLTACGSENILPTDAPQAEGDSGGSQSGTVDGTENSTESSTDEQITPGNDNGNSSGENGGGNNGVNGDGNSSNENTLDDNSDNENDTPVNVVVDEATTSTTYKLESSVLNAGASSVVADYFAQSSKSWGTSYNYGVAPFVLKSSLNIGTAKLKTITIPVMSTGEADGNGDFIFTLYVFDYKNSAAGYANVPSREYKIKVSASKYGLTAGASNIKKLIKVDISSYNILLRADQTLGFTKSGDTLVPLYLKAEDTNKAFIDDFCAKQNIMKGFYGKVGTASPTQYNDNVLLYDFTYEKQYATEAEYTAAVRSEFAAGKEKTYLDAADFVELQSRLLNSGSMFTQYSLSTGYPSYTPSLNYGLSGCKLTAIQIPVYRVTTADNGNYKFTVRIYENRNLTTLSGACKSEKTILISADTYGLSDDDTVNKFINVDLTSYNIELDADDVLAFASENDTLIAGYLKDDDMTSSAYKFISSHDLLKHWCNFYMHVGNSNCNYVGKQGRAILYNFSYVTTSSSANAYLANDDFNKITTVTFKDIDKKIEKVTEVYGDKYVSVLGDSISTYEGYTVSGNDLWYTSSANIPKAGLTGHTDTYWGRFLAQCNMKLAVNNAWSGSRFGGKANKVGDKVFDRARSLAKEGQKPDLIFAYYGINNTASNAPCQSAGDLMVLLENRGSKAKAEVIEQWLSNFKNNNYTGGADSAPDTFDKCYAYMLYTLSVNYEDAQVVCLSLVPTQASNYTASATLVPQYNEIIKELCDYFGYIYVDQSATMNANVSEAFQTDGLHPNYEGHRRMFETVVNTLYAHIVAKEQNTDK